MNHTPRTILAGCTLLCSLILLTSCQGSGAPQDIDDAALSSPSDLSDMPLPTMKNVTEPAGNADEVIARVNGEEITRKQYDVLYADAQMMAASQGIDPESEEAGTQARENALDQLIGTLLIIQEAEKTGINIGDDMIDAEYQTTATEFGGEESLLQQLAVEGMTMEELRGNIRNQMQIQQYLDGQLAGADTSVSEEEALAEYDSVADGQEGVPPYEEVKDQLISGLKQQKEQEFIFALVSRLRNEADVEILLAD